MHFQGLFVKMISMRW